ncbi:hypothetical protein GQX74_005572 [Glossina fuscipes]|nr:hypothetical protein GQX74_005572 [Glossina fuscipes]
MAHSTGKHQRACVANLTFISGVKIDQSKERGMQRGWNAYEGSAILENIKHISEKLVPFKINDWKTAENALLFLATPMTRSQQTQPDQRVLVVVWLKVCQKILFLT